MLHSSRRQSLINAHIMRTISSRTRQVCLGYFRLASDLIISMIYELEIARLFLKLHSCDKVNCDLNTITYILLFCCSMKIFLFIFNRNISISVYFAQELSGDIRDRFRILKFPKGLQWLRSDSETERRADCTRKTIYRAEANKSVVLDRPESEGKIL